jgi:two-component system OmpR family sensor kinase
MSRLPIRVRLMLAFSVATAALLAAGGFLLFNHLAVSLDRALDQSLRARAADVAALIRQADSGLRQAPPAAVAGAGESFAQVLDARGRIVDETRGLGSRSLLDAHQLARARSGVELIRRAHRLKVEVRLLALPVHAQDRRLVIVVGASLRSHDEALASLRSELLVGGPVALLLVSMIGYLLAAAALRPVERMRAHASSISERRLAERLPIPAAADELARLGETLNEMLARIESGVERERSFIADASHELRTPLSLLRAEVELALEAPRCEEELRAALASIGEEADRLSQLAEDLLLLARLDEGGRLPLREETVDLASLFRAVATRFGRRAIEAGRSIQIDAAGLGTRADRPRLEQALTNLVENALRHGDGTIRLVASRDAEGVEIHVIDEGRGLPPAFAAVAFERFTRADPARGGGGAGLGLAIVKAVAEAHGGGAGLSTPAAGGCDVWFRLPRSESAEGELSGEPRTSEAASRGRGGR